MRLYKKELIMLGKKREGGKKIKVNNEEIYQVIEESRKAGGVLFHKCGTLIELACVTLVHRVAATMSVSLPGNDTQKEIWVPYCPNCEHKPTHGQYYDTGQKILTAWDKS